MQALDILSRAFVLLHADWSVEAARRTLDGAAASHVIVQRSDVGGGEYWYLFRIEAARQMLAAASPAATVRSAFQLREPGAAPTVDTEDELAPDRPAIVLDEGRLAGFVDPSPAPVEAIPPPVAPPGPQPLPPAPRSGGPTFRGGSRGQRARPPTAGAEPPTAGAGPTPRSLEADFPGTVALDAVGWLTVTIVSGGPSGTGVAIAVAGGDRVDILVQARRGFVVEGEDHGTIEVAAGDESAPLLFKLKATEEGVGRIQVVAFLRGQSLGLISLSPTVEAARASRGRGSAVGRTPARKSKPLSAPSPSQPDLHMFIEQRQAGAKPEYRILLTASAADLDLNLKDFGWTPLNLDPGTFFTDFFAEIENLPLDTPEQQDLAERRLAAKGTYLSEQLFPPALRDKLWEVRDRIASILIQSEEPWIPWELCKLVGRENGKVVEGKFLCEAYTISRWRPGVGFKPTLTMRNLALVVPADSGLALSQPEAAFVRSLAKGKRTVADVPATFVDVRNAFAGGTYDGWHFTGHGAAQNANPDRSAMILQGEVPFTPEDVSGQAENVGLTKPLVFINACQIGRGGLALTGIGGWADRFMKAGSGAFIGAYWSVYDEPAFEFARQVYGKLLDGAPIGEAVRDARIAVHAQQPGDPTWLAYTLFADPLARVV